MVDPVKVVEDVKDKVVETGKGWLGNIISWPFGLVKGAVMAPFRAIGGIFKGIYNSTIGDILGVLTTGGIITATAKIAPDLLMAVPLPGSDKTAGEVMAKHAQDGGTPAIIKDSMIASAVLNAAKGAVGGALGEVMDSGGSKDTSGAEKVGGMLGAVATVAGLGMLAFSAVKSNNIGFSGSADNSGSQTPANTPSSADTAKGATKA